MKTLREYINEDQFSFNGFVVPRDNMPQILNMKDFINFVDQQGIDYLEYNGSVLGLRPTQHNFDGVKVKRIIADIQADGSTTIEDMTPIVVSEDDFVMDGHHRFKAAKETLSEVPILKVGLTINKLFKLVLDYGELRSGD